MRQKQGIYELALGVHRMSGLAFESNGAIARVPILVDKLADAAAIKAVAEICAYLAYIQCLCAPQALLLVRYEASDYLAVFYLRILDEKFQRIYDRGDRRLIVGA